MVESINVESKDLHSHTLLQGGKKWEGKMVFTKFNYLFNHGLHAWTARQVRNWLGSLGSDYPLTINSLSYVLEADLSS